MLKCSEKELDLNVRRETIPKHLTMQKQQLEQGYLDGHMNKDLNKRSMGRSRTGRFDQVLARHCKGRTVE
jgi:hypothetical protein